jgi:GT2 family glycosyltransferase
VLDKTTPVVIVPNWNGQDTILACLESLLQQRPKPHIIVVDNGSDDGSPEMINAECPVIEIIRNEKNLGFAEGVNIGIRRADSLGAKYVALFNNDAVADRSWLKPLVDRMEADRSVGITTGKILDSAGKNIDSTGELYTVWGLPFPRGRGRQTTDEYDGSTDIFAASGGASLYRLSMFKEVGLFDKDYFAYYEDVDISFRARLVGWKIAYVPAAKAYHATGTTSAKLKGFTTYQTMKNLPWLLWRNVPAGLLYRVVPRFCIAYAMFWARALMTGGGWAATRGVVISIAYMPKKIFQRYRIQHNRSVTTAYISSILTWDLPPNATNLRELRAWWWKIVGRK